jgi:hypothetical protein
MASKQTWDNYRSPGIVKTDEELLSMVKDVVETIHTLEKMYSNGGAKLVVWGLLQDWHALSSMASSRGLTYEHP